MSEIRAKPYIDWLRNVAGLTVREIALLVGVSPITVNTVWIKPPGYISEEKLTRLRYIKELLEEAMKAGRFDPALLPHPNSPRGGRQRLMLLREILDT